MSVATKLMQMGNIKVNERDHEHTRKKIVDILDKHIEAMLYNVASLVCVLTIASGKSKIELKHVEEMQRYITNKCTHKHKGGATQSGGTSMPSEYFGYSTGAYAAGNSMNVPIVSDIQFGQGIARMSIDSTFGMQSGGGHNRPWHIANASGYIKKYVATILKNNDVKASKIAMSSLLHVVDVHLTCLADDLSKVQPLTLAKTEKAIELKRHSIFR